MIACAAMPQFSRTPSRRERPNISPEEWTEEWTGVYSRKRGHLESSLRCRGGGALTLFDLQWHDMPAAEWERRQRLVIATAICADRRCTISPNTDEAGTATGVFTHPWMGYELGKRGSRTLDGFGHIHVAYQDGDVLVNATQTPLPFGSVTVPPMDAAILLRGSRPQPPR